MMMMMMMILIKMLIIKAMVMNGFSERFLTLVKNKNLLYNLHYQDFLL